MTAQKTVTITSIGNLVAVRASPITGARKDEKEEVEVANTIVGVEGG